MLPFVINGLSRRTLFAGTLGGLAAPSAASLAAPSAAGATAVRGRLPSRPNIVLILADDLGWGEIGSQGQRKIHTPNLDQMAAEGVRFATAYSGAPLCAPSRCALLTGLHAGHGTVRDNPEGGPQHSLTDADLTFAELLRLSGYRTACIGKWGFGPEVPHQASHPNMRGFDEFFGYITHRHAHHYFPSYLWHNDKKVSIPGRSYAPHLFRERATEFIAEGGDDPFLLYYASNLPHAPSAIPGDAGVYEKEPWSDPNRRHAAQVTRLDTDVAALLRALRDAGVAERTLVLFTSDNGPHREKGVTPRLFNSNGPYRADKRDVYEGGIRVPLIAWAPGLRHRVERQPVAFWDVLPTFADLAEVPVPAHLDGRSFRGLLTGGSAPRHHHLVWNRPRKAQAIRRGRWKAVRFAPNIAGAGPEGRVELYDLSADPGEKLDLAADRPELTAELLATLDASIGPDPRTPYGLRTELTDDQVIVTLHNGSSRAWRGVELGLDGPRKRRAHRVPRLEPGAAITVGFPLPAKRGRIVARATFTHRGRRHVFRARHVKRTDAAALH
ncbi:Tat pathway signal sequence domain protein [Nonomuraea mesophila]|uniref:Tat pathway signal sequence domain protein n=1 Tax=Nonomuraea mesophila TaxID=2530382 RepID=A0A4R5FX93_9ACTN|nr:Tat pathway signal sequence domain protein [Nonomuraea mesophila]